MKLGGNGQQLQKVFVPDRFPGTLRSQIKGMQLSGKYRTGQIYQPRLQVDVGEQPQVIGQSALQPPAYEFETLRQPASA